MSRDLILFDPSGLAGFDGEAPEINTAIDAYMANSEYDATDATASIQQFLAETGGNFVGSYLSGQGRYCNINQPGDPGNWENTIMSFSARAKKLGLILLDPQGNNPVMSTPNGKGLMDF